MDCVQGKNETNIFAEIHEVIETRKIKSCEYSCIKNDSFAKIKSR